jgi:Ca2+-binding RTX toxin-like protein
MLQFVKKWFSKQCAPTQRSYRPTLEVLENRQLLSASAVISNSVLVIQGTDANELISVAPVVGSTSVVEVKISVIDPTTFATIGSPTLDKKFDIGKVTKIQMSGLGGVDVLINNTAIQSEQFGGKGNDILAGGGANDTLRGEAGDDRYAFPTANFTNLGSDTVIENDGDGTDTLDFSAIGTNVKLDMAINAVAQNVASNLTLTLKGPIENAQGSAYGDSLRGNALNNYINGGGGEDSLEGREGDDTLVGASGNDTYVFANTNHTILGTDTIGEGSGAGADAKDTLNFSGMDAGVTVDLAAVYAQGVNGQLLLILTDGLGIENVIGSNFIDHLTGNARNNTLDGRADNDVIEGRQGDDTLIGGAGTDFFDFNNTNGEYLGADTVVESLGVNDTSLDTLNFEGMQGAVTIDLGLANTMQEVVYKQLKLTLTDAGGIEGVYGWLYNDVIKGNARDNMLDGQGGNDTLYGYGGKDLLIGGGNVVGDSNGSDDDYIYGGDGDDDLRGGNGNDHLFGEAGTDTLYGGLGADFLNGGFDGCQDTLYGYTVNNNSDGDVDTLITNGYTSQSPEDLAYGDSMDVIQQ